MSDVASTIASLLQLSPGAVRAALALFDEGSTVPFVARYRRERTGGLDEVQLRQIADAHRQHVELQDRRSAILKALTEQGVLTDALRATIAACQTRSALEDAYAPYKKRRKTRADNAKEKGLEPLAELLLAQTRRGNPITDATSYVDPSKGVTSVDEALAGARDIVAETLASRPTLRSLVRQDVGDHGMLSSSATKKTEGADDFRDYADHTERAARVPSHRYLAMCRGEAEGVLTIKIRPDLERTLQQLLRAAKLDRGSPWAEQMRQATDDALRRLLLPAAERRVRAILKEHADDEAIEVFQRNLEALLLAAPLGGVSVLGIDPGIRTGCKCALVSETGALVEHQVLHLVGRKDPQTDRLAAWLSRARPAAVAVGNGTGGREALAAVRTALREAGMDVPAVSVSESGASIYSASELARQELPDVDLTVRSAAHIARRLQDPLAELVKVPPGSIGVGQYQHDVDDKKLTRKLSEVVESCVNRVGVDVNTASPALLAHVAGIGPKLAERIVAHRQANGAFRRRRDLLDVQGLGKKTFEQCAGFLRIRDGSEPLDASAVHPERYKLVARMARDLGCSVAELVGDAAKARTIQMDRYVDEDTGLQTLADIVGELTKPGRDPRQAFEAPAFRDDVQELSDVREGMVLHGVVTNVTNFGAFVDVGVHQDGLVHISQLADRYVSSPHEVVSAGQSVKVKVLEVDLDRRRISLSMKQA